MDYEARLKNNESSERDIYVTLEILFQVDQVLGLVKPELANLPFRQNKTFFCFSIDQDRLTIRIST